MPSYVVFYKKWIEEGDNRAGWAGYKDYVHFCENEEVFMNWMDSTEYLRHANNNGRRLNITGIQTFEKVGEIDPAIANAESAMRVEKKERAEKKAKLLKEREELDRQINEL